MPSLKDIRKRITSVKNTQKITRAMKLVAASKLRRAQEAIEAARPYATKVGEVVSVLAAAVDSDAHPLLETREEVNKALLMVITSDKGLCGPFNTGLMRKVESFIRHNEDINFELVIIGKKGSAYFPRRGYTVHSENPELLAKGVTAAIARQITEELVEKFTSNEFDAVYLAYNEFHSAINQEQRVEQLLPVVPAKGEGEHGEGEGEGHESEFLFEPGKEELLDVLLPQYVQTAVYRAMLDSMASEQGSRMSAMDSATNNASDMINNLTLTYNRARQAAITRELVEITTGAQALEG
jgi:F-type H+-transporting ATPase subunit gamma